MMMTAKMASVAMPISMISGPWARAGERHVATVLHKAVPEDLLEDVALEMMQVRPTKKCAKLMARAESHLSGGQAQARDHREADGTSRPVRMMVHAGLMEEVSVLSAGEPIFCRHG
ncbi:MAG: hypothetical protein ACLU37_04510 [Collinsella sp.]